MPLCDFLFLIGDSSPFVCVIHYYCLKCYLHLKKIYVLLRPAQFLSFQCCQALGVCSHSDRSALKKKLKEMKKSEEKGQKKGEKRLKEEKEKERNVVLLKDTEEKDKAAMTVEGQSVKDGRHIVKVVRTESLL